jgi:HD superfamily phosphodiesterase
MLPRLYADRNEYGESIRDRIPPPSPEIGIWSLADDHVAIWDRATPFLTNRDNDIHTIYAYGLARALLDTNEEANPDVVLPAILLHDTGWSQVAMPEIMRALAPGAREPETIRKHEIEGARIAREVLDDLGYPKDDIDEIVEIIDGHDTRLRALSLNDALVKDADKLWRITPRGIDTVMDWFGLSRSDAHRMCASRVHGYLFTEAARIMARSLSAVAWVDSSPQRVTLDER